MVNWKHQWLASSVKTSENHTNTRMLHWTESSRSKKLKYILHLFKDLKLMIRTMEKSNSNHRRIWINIFPNLYQIIWQFSAFCLCQLDLNHSLPWVESKETLQRLYILIRITLKSNLNQINLSTSYSNYISILFESNPS